MCPKPSVPTVPTVPTVPAYIAYICYVCYIAYICCNLQRSRSRSAFPAACDCVFGLFEGAEKQRILGKMTADFTRADLGPRADPTPAFINMN